MQPQLHTLRRTIALGAILWLAVFAGGHPLLGHPTVLAEGPCPPVANTPAWMIVYGTVTLDGSPAPEGTVVEARSPRSDPVGCWA